MDEHKDEIKITFRDTLMLISAVYSVMAPIALAFLGLIVFIIVVVLLL
jgi:hypothetical protein